MDVYERHVLQGAIAGLITGAVVAALAVLMLTEHLDSLAEELVRHQLPVTLPPEEVEKAIKSVKEITHAALRIAPVAQVFQYLLFGAVFGLMKGAFRNKLNLSEAVSALSAGLFFILILGVLPIGVLSALMAGLVDTVSKYFNLYLAALLPGALFTASITLISIVRGPWSRIIEATPKEV